MDLQLKLRMNGVRFDELQYEERDNTTLWRSIELVVDFIF